MIAVEHLTVQVGTFRLNDVSLEIPTGQYGILMGKTGCGKSTLVEAICGLKQIKSGHIFLMDRDVTGLKPSQRGIGYVPQDGALFPSMNVHDHLAFALQIRRVKRKEIKARVAELASLLDIEPLLDRRIKGLSGGEKQRVALGRALSFRPPILCLDEPLSALDHDTRNDMCDLLQTVKEKTGVTIIHITHDRAEAARLADCTFVMDGGVIREAVPQDGPL